MAKEGQKLCLAAETPCRPPSRIRAGAPAHATFAACCLGFFVMIIFLHNHNSMAYVHSTIVYSLEAPAGWLQSTSRTTVRAVTIKNAAGEAVTRAAVTATTTTTTVAAGAAAAAASGSSSQGRWKRSIISRWPRPQHSSTQQLAAETATAHDPLPGEGQPVHDIELHPQRVAQVVRKAKAAAQVQQIAEEGADTQATTAAEELAGLYGAGGAGSVVFESLPDMDSCPQGTAAPPRGATAIVLLADSSSGAAVLKRSLDGLMLLYSQASADIRAGFHLYIGLDGDNQEMYQLAHQYALDSLGALKLVHNRRSSATAGTHGSGASTSSSSSSDGQRHSLGPAGPEGSASTDTGKGVGTLAQVGGAARADHVRLMLHVVLQCFQYPSVLLLEDDWKLLPDFFEYFDAARWLLDSDPTLSCISAWNPLAQQHQHHSRHDMARLQRVDTNPGHGWLIGRATGLQLINTWPQAKPDFDLQQHIHRMGLQYGQQCVVPDVARMVPAAVHDTGEAAHIVAPPDSPAGGDDRQAAGGAVLGSAGSEVSTSSESMALSGSSEGKSDSDSESESDSSTSGQGLPEDIGAVDQDAADAPEVAWAPATDDNPAAAAAGHRTGSRGGETAAQQQHEQHDEQEAQSVWLGRDLSFLMASGYRQWLQQRLLKATAVDVTAAAQLPARAKAARVTYSSPAELTAAAEALGVPLTLTQNVRYCYSLPSSPPTQHCQDYLPDMAYEGVITAHTREGVRLYFVHLAYIHALQARPATQAASVDAPAEVATV